MGRRRRCKIIFFFLKFISIPLLNFVGLKTKVDRKHWNKFSSFQSYSKSFNDDRFDYDYLKNSDHVFMRWKELFLVPDHTIRDISGASFAGFYYICFQKSTSTIEGYYYHRSSEWYQSLMLNHLDEHSTSAYEFR